MPPKSNVPIRICGSKTRSGCKTCKQRHIKCDERQPICMRCQKGNRDCIWEQLQLRTSSADQSTASTALQGGHYRGLPSHIELPDHVDVSGVFDFITSFAGTSFYSNPSPHGIHDTTEITAIKHFANYLGNELSGCFSKEVWCDMLPRVAHHEPLIWQTLVAVGMLDMSIRLDPIQAGTQRIKDAAVGHYIKSIHELNMRLSSCHDLYSQDVVLLSCVLFAVFETLQNRYGPALTHINGGLKLLMMWAKQTQPGSLGHVNGHYDRASLHPIFLTLNSQAIQMGVVPFQDNLVAVMYDQMQMPTLFATADEAHHWLNYIFNRISYWGQWLDFEPEIRQRLYGQWIVLEKQRLQNQLEAWDSAFATLLHISSSQPAVMLLVIQRKVITAFFNKQSDGDSEMEWDKYLPLFEEIVEQTELYMRLSAPHIQPLSTTLDNASETRTQGKPIFSITMDIVLPLFLIATKCRDSATRRRALAMLYSCGRKEGIWDSVMCAREANAVIDTEEQFADENGFIPESGRVFGLDVRLHKDGSADARLKTHAANNNEELDNEP